MKFNLTLIFAIFSQFMGCYTGDKAHLKLLVTSPQTGHTSSAGRPCVAAAEIALEAANADETFMPGFQIEMQYENDGYASYQPRAIVRYFRKHLQQQSENNTFGMPIGVGFLHSPGVLRTGKILPYFRMNMISVGGQSIPMSIFTNVFKTRAETPPYMDAIVKFMVHFKWYRVAILSSADSSLGFRLSKDFIPKAEKANIEIIWYENIQQLDQHYAQSLLQVDARVIFMPHLETPIANMFLCQLYRQGITGHRFQFIALNTVAYFGKEDIPYSPICTSDELMIQYRQTIFVGSRPYSPMSEKTTISRLGYNVTYFNERFFKKIEGIKPNDIAYINHCHDGMLHALMTLENTQLELNKHNLSLTDVYNEQEKVFGMVHEQLKTTTYRGIRMPNVVFHPMKPNEEPIVIQKIGSDDDRWIYPWQVFNEEIEEIETDWWKFEKVANDRPSRVVNVETLPGYAYAIISVIQVIACLYQMTLLVLLWLRDKGELNITSVLGCLLLNVAAAILLLNNEVLSKTVVCNLEVAILTLAMTTLNRGLIFSSVYGLLEQKKVKREQQLTSTRHTIFRGAAISRIAKPEQKKATFSISDKLLHFISICFLLVNMILLLCWFATSDIGSQNKIMATVYDEIKDQYIDTMAISCKSELMNSYSMSIFAVNIIPMILVALIAYVKRFVQWEGRYRTIVVALFNTIFFMFLATIAVFIVTSNLGRELVIILITISTSFICSSAISISVFKQ